MTTADELITKVPPVRDMAFAHVLDAELEDIRLRIVARLPITAEELRRLLLGITAKAAP